MKFFRLMLYACFFILLLQAPVTYAETTTEDDVTAETRENEQTDTKKEKEKEKEESLYRYGLGGDLSEEELETIRSLKQLRLQREKLELEIQLLQTKNERKLTELKLERDRLLFQAELEDARYQQKVAQMIAEKEQLALENSLADEQRIKQQAVIENQKNLLSAENNLVEERNRKIELEVAAETAQMDFERLKANNAISSEIEMLGNKISKREQQLVWDVLANNEPEYLSEPLDENNVLVISDRKIELPRIIERGTAKYVLDQINYFNNKDKTYPIFLIIEGCAGGSIYEGAQIIQAMKASRAPVYVVVKSYAASMAAVITTLAERSYVYENATIVHHQIIGGFSGNITQQREYMKFTEKWSQRLLKPVADKMGISLEEFRTKMYASSTTGNWMVFADEAKELHWLTHTITGIRDTSVIYPVEMPEENPYAFLMGQVEADQTAPTPATRKHPPLNVGDFYYMTQKM